jgi:hypothetical protein
LAGEMELNINDRKDEVKADAVQAQVNMDKTTDMAVDVDELSSVHRSEGEDVRQREGTQHRSQPNERNGQKPKILHVARRPHEDIFVENTMKAFGMFLSKDDEMEFMVEPCRLFLRMVIRRRMEEVDDSVTFEMVQLTGKLGGLKVKKAPLPVSEVLETPRADEKQGRVSVEDTCVDVYASDHDSDELEDLYDRMWRTAEGLEHWKLEVDERIKAGWDYPMIQDELGVGPVDEEGIPELARVIHEAVGSPEGWW